MKPIDGIPRDYELIDSDGVYYSPIHQELVITGTPGEEDERHNCDHMGCSSIGHVIFRAKVSSFSFAIKEDTTGWKRIESTFYQEFRCLVSDGRNVGMGGYMDGQWYADDMSPIMSEEITHYLIVGTPVKEDERV